MDGKHVLTPKRVKELAGECPPVAYVTLLLTVACIATEVYVALMIHDGRITPLTGTTINTMAIFAVFTPMHDASHGSVATVRSGHRYINDTVGLLAGLCFPIPYFAFKYLHLLHHKYTNDPVNDPDSFAGAGPSYTLPFRWMLMECKQYTNYFPKLLSFQRPLFESIITLFTIIGYVAVAVVGFKRGYGKVLWYGWVLPGRIAISLLAFAFDYLPHRPHDVPRSVSDYEATCVLSVAGEWTSPLTYPLLYQNYHNIHHLAPYVPFYYYETIWHAVKEDLLLKGTIIKPLFGGDNSVLATMRMVDKPLESNKKIN